MTAREFLMFAGYEDTEENLFQLSQYVDSNVDFSQFPDADVFTSDGNTLELCINEPAGFQEYLDNIKRY